MKPLSKRGEQIVDAAIELVSSGGIPALTTRNLAAAVGVTEPALYRHFKGKLDILAAILNRIESNMQRLFAQGAERHESVLDLIHSVYMRIFHNFEKNPALAAVVFSEELFRHDPRLADQIARIMDTTEKHIVELLQSAAGRNECRQDVPVKDLARVMMGSSRLLVTRWRLSGHAFSLVQEGAELWHSLGVMVAAQRISTQGDSDDNEKVG